ncbi:MAG: serine hydrolase [Dehalococcoidia bacterium]|nr:serine hydrolase [Dehalococcoidia bacterium]
MSGPSPAAWRLLLLAALLSVGLSVAVLVRALDGVGAATASHSAAIDVLEPLPATATLPRQVFTATAEAPLPSPTALPPAATPVPLQDDARLRAVILEALGPDVEDYAVAVWRLADGRSATIDGERVFYAASLFKMAVLYEAERRHAAGELSFDDSVTLTAEDVAEDLGTLAELGAGEGDAVPVWRLLEAMVTFSDNTSAVALLHHLGGAAVDATLRGLGLEQTSVNTEELPTTAAEMAALMGAAIAGTGVGPEAAAEMRALLARQTIRSGIPRGVPEDVHVGNKTGTWAGATHDVAYVEAPGGDYVLAVLSDGEGGWEPIVRVSAAVYAEMAGAEAGTIRR